MSTPTALATLPHALRLLDQRMSTHYKPSHMKATDDGRQGYFHSAGIAHFGMTDTPTDIDADGVAALRNALPAQAEMAEALLLLTGELYITVTATGERTHVNALLEPIAQRILSTLPADIVQAAKEAAE